MGIITSKMYNLYPESHIFRINILESNTSQIPEKFNKWLILETDYMTLRGINNIYIVVRYDKIKSWNIDSNYRKIKFIFTNGDEILIKCNEIEDLIEIFKNEIVLTMINSNYSKDDINNACREFNIEDIFINDK